MRRDMMKRNLLALLYVTSIVQIQGRTLQERNDVIAVDEKAPWFCHDLDCPKFKVLNTTEKYQIREYENSVFATTKVDSLVYGVGVSRGFKRLFDYISGKNEENQKIPMTAPVSVNVVPGQGPFCESHLTVNFFVPFAYQKHTPKPTNPDVYISKSGRVKLAVSQFGGYAVDDWTISTKANSLKKALETDDIAYNGTSFFVAGYDDPFKLQHRHNEIWIVLELQSQDSEMKNESFMAQ